MSEGPVDVACVQRDCRGIDGLGRRLWSGWPASGLTFADLQVEAGALDELALARIALDDAAKAVGGRFEIVALERADAGLVDGQGFVESRAARRSWRCGRLPAWSRVLRGRPARTPTGAARAGALAFLTEPSFDGFDAFGLGESFDTLAPFESFSALGAFGLVFLAAGRTIDRLAAARRCFGMQFLAGLLGP